MRMKKHVAEDTGYFFSGEALQGIYHSTERKSVDFFLSIEPE